MIIGIAGVCSRLAGELVQALAAVARSSSSPDHCLDPTASSNYNLQKPPHRQVDDDSMMMGALTAVFGMENNGKINKEKARQVLEKLGLVHTKEAEEESTDVEEVLRGMEGGAEREQLLHEAFNIFDENGNGYIEAAELKRVLQCLGVDKGWDIGDIEKMLRVVDLNFDGKVDFREFELMMTSF